jgi:hypothetical protein
VLAIECRISIDLAQLKSTIIFSLFALFLLVSDVFTHKIIVAFKDYPSNFVVNLNSIQ